MSDWRALSMSQPWLELVLRGLKPVENRRRNLGRSHLPFILHGAQSDDGEHARAFLASRGLGQREGLLRTPEDALIQLALAVEPRRGFCGVARSVGLLEPYDSRAPGVSLTVESLGVQHRFDLAWWMREQYGYLLVDVRQFEVVPGPGRLGFFRVDPDVVAKLGLPPSPEEYLARGPELWHPPGP